MSSPIEQWLDMAREWLATAPTAPTAPTARAATPADAQPESTDQDGAAPDGAAPDGAAPDGAAPDGAEGSAHQHCSAMTCDWCPVCRLMARFGGDRNEQADRIVHALGELADAVRGIVDPPGRASQSQSTSTRQPRSARQEASGATARHDRSQRADRVQPIPLEDWQ